MDLSKKRGLIGRQVREWIIESSFFFAAIASILVMVVIFYYLIRESLTFMEVGVFDLVFGMKWHSAGEIFGMTPIIVGSIMVTLLALLINILVGVPLAVYLSELAEPGAARY